MSAGVPLESLPGVISGLRTSEGAEDFVLQSGDRAMGEAAAIVLAIGGLAGAATGALFSAGDTSDKVTFFDCLVDSTPVYGRFGEVTFRDGDRVEIAGVRDGSRFIAYAVARPIDRTIWMFPYCGRGTSAFLATTLGWIVLLCWIVVPAVMLALDVVTSTVSPPLDFWMIALPALGIFLSAIFGLVTWRFRRFAHLSDAIFSALGFANPRDTRTSPRRRT